MHRYILVLVIAVCSVAGASAQYFVIDPQDPSVVVIDIPDTVVSSLSGPNCMGRNYNLDMDKNGVNDFQFGHYCSWGSTGFTDKIIVMSFDGAYFVRDTAITDTVPGITFIAKPFEINDTVDYNSDFTDISTHISRREHSGSTGNYQYDVTDWHGAPRYMAIRKEINGQLYYGWIRINVHGHNEAVYMEYALNYPYIGVEEFTSPEIMAFPNPVAGVLHIPSGAADITITDMTGKEVYRHITGSEKLYAVDITSLTAGVYILQADGVTQKIVKQ